MVDPFAPAHAELLLGGTWTDVIADVRGMGPEDGRIAITRGQRDESSSAQPTRVALALNDNDGTYEWRDPTSTYWGQLRRGTPLRIYRGTPHVGAVNSDLTDTVSHVAPSVVSPTAEGLLVCAWACPEGFGDTYNAFPGGMTTTTILQTATGSLTTAYQAISATGATGTRTATFSVAEDYVASSVLFHGDTLAVEESAKSTGDFTTGASTQAGWWVTISTYFGWSDVEAESEIPDLPSDDDGGGWILLGDTGTLVAGDADAGWIRMKTWAKRVRRGGAFAIRMHAPTTLPALDFPVDALSGMTVVSGVGTWDIRAHARLSSLPARRDVSGNVRWVPLEAAGALRQVDRRRSPTHSTIYRAVMARTQDAYRVAYWPCEDGSGATSLGSAVPGVQPMTIDERVAGGGITGGDYDGFAGSAPLPTMLANATTAIGNVPPYATGATYYRGLFAIPAIGLGAAGNVVNLQTTGTARRYQIKWASGSSGTLQLISYDGDGGVLSSSAVTAFAVTGTQFLLTVELVQDGADVDYLVFVRKSTATQVEDGALISGTFTGQTVGRVSQVRVGGGIDLAFGHQMVGTSQALVFNIRDALVGYTGETAADRIRRLCREAGVQCAIVGDRSVDGDLPMGPERPGQTLAGLLRECATTGGGILYEPREFYGIAYRTVRSLYGQSSALGLTYDAAGEVVPPLEPVPDDALVVNDVTVSNTGGGDARAVQESGPLNINDPDDDDDGVGALEESATVNVASSVDLPSQARWRLHAGTLAEDRFPSLQLYLEAMEKAGKTALLESAAALDVGDRLTIDGLPTSFGPNDVSQLAVGFHELISQREWQVGTNNVPEATYGLVLRYAAVSETPAADEPVFYGSDVATVKTAVNTSQTSVRLIVGATEDWVYEDDFDIVIGGERMTVTAVAAATLTFPGRDQVLTVTRAVNGVEKSHDVGDPVALWRQGVWGL